MVRRASRDGLCARSRLGESRFNLSLHVGLRPLDPAHDGGRQDHAAQKRSMTVRPILSQPLSTLPALIIFKNLPVIS